MKTRRVKKGETYWFLSVHNGTLYAVQNSDDRTGFNNSQFEAGNYFPTKEKAAAIALKFNAILADADVIETPTSEKVVNAYEKHIAKYKRSKHNAEFITGFSAGFFTGIEWLKSKIVK